MLDSAIHGLQEVAGSGGREWEVLLIAAGTSRNDHHYPAETLQAAAALFEGAAVFADHPTDAERAARPERSVRDKVGRVAGVSYGAVATPAGPVEGLRARLKVVAPWLRETLREAVELGEPDFLGFSINAEGRVSRREHAGRPVAWVEAITRVHSVDVVTEPAAGGRLVRLVASAGQQESETAMEPEEITRLIADQVGAAVQAAVPTLVEAVTATVTAPAETALLAEARRLLTEQRVDRALAAASGLSQPGREFVRAELLREAERADRALSEDEIGARVARQQDYEAALRPVAAPTSAGRARLAAAPHDQMVAALQGWFRGEPVELNGAKVRPFGSLREAYCRWTGADPFELDLYEFASAFACRYDSRTSHAALQESLSRASWGEVFADNLYVMMIRSYRDSEAYANWRRFVSDLESVPDFQTRHWVRVGGYGDLSAVAERETYPQLTSPTDEEVSYSISKRGGLDDVSLESLTDPRSNRMRKVPEAMGRSARRTLFKFVMNLITTDNPTLDYDSTALYHANHGNTGTTALSVSGLHTTQVAMRDQTAYNETNEILGERNRIRYLIVPNELEGQANRVVNPSEGYTFALATTPDADTSIDPAYWRGKGIEVVVYDQLTDATDWWAVADPAQVPTLVMGFLNGNQEPELFVQDDPATGSVFTADKITYKVRHIYGGDILEHRSFYRNVVA